VVYYQVVGLACSNWGGEVVGSGATLRTSHAGSTASRTPRIEHQPKPRRVGITMREANRHRPGLRRRKDEDPVLTP